MPRGETLQKIQQLRYVAYICFALLVLSLSEWLYSPYQLLLGIAFCSFAPLLVHSLQDIFGHSTGNRIPFLHLFAENGMVSFVTGYLLLPPACGLAVFTVLLCGNVSQGGWVVFRSGLICIALGWSMGFYLAPGSTVINQTPDVTWLVSALMLVGFSTLISALGYQQTMRIHKERVLLDTRSRELKILNARLAKYLAPQVYARLFASGEDRIPLSRRWLTVCFIDLVGFTALSNRLSPEELSRVLNDFMTAMAELCAEHGATLDKFVGDGLLVFFGDTPHAARTKDALEAVAMGRAAQLLVQDLSRMWLTAGLCYSISARVGIASGFCTVGDFGQGERRDYTILGAPVNLAKRLQELKPSPEQDGVVISAATQALVGKAIELGTFQHKHLKDFPDEIAKQVV